VRQSPQEHIVKRPLLTVLLWLWMGGLCLAATAPVAMRVEVEPLRSGDGTTVVEVVVQVSPEDRTRVGDNAIVRLELDGGTVAFGSPMRGVRFDSDGSARIEVAWPPGEHDLRVVLEVPRSDATGLWVGKVRIPETVAGAAAAAVAAPLPAPTAKTVAVEPAMPPAPTPVPESKTVAAEPIAPPAPTPVPAVAAARPTPAPVTPPEVEIEFVAEPEPEPAPEAVTAVIAAEAELEPESAPEAEATVAEPPPAPVAPPDVEVEIVAEPEPEPAPEAVAEQVAPEPAPTAPPPIVEPLRANPPPATEAPRAEPVGEAASAAAPAGPISAELASRLDAWEVADPQAAEFTIIATRARKPVRDLGVDDLQLRIDGKDAVIESLGDAEHAPLLLGLAFDVNGGGAGGWASQRGTLEPLARRAVGGRGRLFIADAAGVGAWGEDPEPPEDVPGASGADNVAQLVAASLAPFEDLRGRTFLIVLTDGRNEPTKTEWQGALAAAGEAGVPVLVIVMWDEDFSPRTRKELKRIAEASGGSLFLVQGSDQLGSATDRFGLALDAGVAVRFQPPPGSGAGTMKVSITATDKELELSAPESIRVK
jgi:hypothetical protein